MARKNRVNDNIEIENAHLMFKNFSGEAGKYNAAGNRNFCVEIDPETAEKLEKDGWNIKTLVAKNPEDDDIKYLSVRVNYSGKNDPVIKLYTKCNGKFTSEVELKEENVGMLDWAEIRNVDLVIRPYNWEVQGDTGVKAYLDVMYVTLIEDKFASKYRDVPDSALSSIKEGNELD